MTSRYEELLLPEQRDRIVGKVVVALKTQGRLPSKTLNEFRDLFKAGKPIPGFNNDPLRAMPPLLKQQLLERLEQNPDDVECLVVGTWADIEPQLLEAVSEHVGSLDPQAYEGDDLDEEFWDAQVRLLTEKHGSYDENDILLMVKVCYAHAKMKADSQRENSEIGSDAQTVRSDPDTLEQSLGDLLASLRELPATLPLWRESVPQFVESLTEIIDRKNDDILQIKGLVDDLDRIQSAFQTELAFFRHGGEDWDTLILATSLATAHGIDESTRRVADLKHAISSYRQIKERAETLAEERERREQRHELEEAIEGMLNEIDELLHATVAESEARSETANDIQQQTRSEADPQLREDFDALQRENAALVDSNRAIKQDTDSLREANRALQGEVTGLNADKKALADEVAELRDQLRISEIKETNWRNAYEAGMSSNDSPAPEPIPAEVESVNRALELANARYGDRLVYWPNKKSDPDYNYRRPKEVWDALEWLAKTYYAVQTGKERVIDLNESIRNTCGGWEYKSSQTDITLNTFREWYETTKDGKTYELREHLAKGTGRDANVIRIAFAWDEDSQRVIVGYVGPHQRTRRS